MRSDIGPSLEARIKRVVARLNETDASMDAFDDHATHEGAADLPDATWSPRLSEDIVHWELVIDGRVAARVFAPFRGGHWRYEVFPDHARPMPTGTLVPRALGEALRRLAAQSPAALLEASPVAARARSAQQRLDDAQDAADDARTAYVAAAEEERQARRAQLETALLDEAAARRESREADLEATTAQVEDRHARRRRGSSP